MSDGNQEALLPKLFIHLFRKDWGVSVVSGERDGKRRYLFEGGEERTMCVGALDMMRVIDAPDGAQQETQARLLAQLARRGARHEAPVARSASVATQLLWFRQRYPKGFGDEQWLGDARRQRDRRLFDAAMAKASQNLSKKVSNAQAAEDRHHLIWRSAVGVLTECELPDTDRLLAVPSGTQPALLGRAVSKLLYGTSAYEQRFDGFVATFDTVFRAPPNWQLATILPALLFPSEHTCVELATFRKQLRAMSRNSVLGPRPSGAAYARCAKMARTISAELAGLGEAARDLFDVYEFVNATSSSVGKAGPKVQ